MYQLGDNHATASEQVLGDGYEWLPWLAEHKTSSVFQGLPWPITTHGDGWITDYASRVLPSCEVLQVMKHTRLICNPFTRSVCANRTPKNRTLLAVYTFTSRRLAGGRGRWLV